MLTLFPTEVAKVTILPEEVARRDNFRTICGITTACTYRGTDGAISKGDHTEGQQG